VVSQAADDATRIARARAAEGELCPAAFEGIIDHALMEGAVERASRPTVEDHENEEARRLAAPCGSAQK
jgi:hypothetical protein